MIANAIHIVKKKKAGELGKIGGAEPYQFAADRALIIDLCRHLSSPDYSSVILLATAEGSCLEP
jgi:hypothetical protein